MIDKSFSVIVEITKYFVDRHCDGTSLQLLIRIYDRNKIRSIGYMVEHQGATLKNTY